MNNNLNMLFFDFEVFKYDWMVVIINQNTNERTYIINDQRELEQFYDAHDSDIWVGYNSRNYDQWILKGILKGMNPYEINQKLIVEGIKGYKIVKDAKDITFNTFDIATGFHSLKQLEGFMGSKIKESSVDFTINSKLSEIQIQEVLEYCIHDVEETMNVFENRRAEFDSQLLMIDTFELDMSMFNKTKAQLSAYVLGAHNRKKHNDEFELCFPDTLRLSEKYKYVLDWYMERNNRDYKKKLCTEISGVPHVFAWGGIHGAIPSYFGEGEFIMSDIASMYPALMIEYDYLSRNVENPEKYREIRDERIILKKKKDPTQLPLKIVLNSTYGAMKDKYNNLYDPLMANNVCIGGQLLLLDLIEKVEPYGELIQSNTDGILVKLYPNQRENYLKVCEEWCKRSRLDLEHDDYIKVIQKDVNNYIIVEPDGKCKTKGAYVKKLSNIDYDLPIVNKALLEYFTNNVPVESTILNCNKLRDFQKIVKISKLYNFGFQGEVIEIEGRDDQGKKTMTKQMGEGVKFREKVLRVFASIDESDKGVFKIKGEDKIEKIGNTPENCFIFNDEVLHLEVPHKLNRQYYIDMALKRIDDFINNTKTKTSEKSDVSGINLNIKTIIDNYLKSTQCKFVKCIEDLREQGCTHKHLEILIKINYFVKFGGSKKLLKLLDFHKKYVKKSTAKKNDLPFEENILRMCSEKETDKQFSKVDFVRVISIVEDNMKNESLSLKEIIKYQQEYLGYINLTQGEDKKRCVITEMNINDYNKKLKLYCLATGATVEFKLKKRDYADEIVVGDIIKMRSYEKSYKVFPRKDENGEVIRRSNGKPKYFDNSKELEWVLKSYIVEE